MTVTREVCINDRIDFLYTDIGRGHPFYLDGIIEAVSGLSEGLGSVACYHIFELTSGRSALAWKAARWLYTKGSSGGPVGAVYGRIRSENNYNRSNWQLRILGESIRERFVDGKGPLVVAHPSLVGILSGRGGLIYQHGEMITPAEAVVSGAETVFVPTDHAAEPFLRAGCDRESVRVTGLCIEPSLIENAESMLRGRLQRLSAPGLPTGAYFSSGAEPTAHIDKLVRCAVSASQAGGRVIVFARRGGRLDRLAEYAFERTLLNWGRCDSVGSIPEDLPLALLVTHDSRQSENDLSCSLFHQFDYFVAPPHERTSWAIGLGCPMFALTPTVGPFAPLNLQLLLEAKTACVIDSRETADRFCDMLAAMTRSGELAAMAQSGWGRYDINGFGNIASYLLDTYTAG